MTFSDAPFRPNHNWQSRLDVSYDFVTNKLFVSNYTVCSTKKETSVAQFMKKKLQQ